MNKSLIYLNATCLLLINDPEGRYISYVESCWFVLMSFPSSLQWRFHVKKFFFQLTRLRVNVFTVLGIFEGKQYVRSEQPTSWKLTVVKTSNYRFFLHLIFWVKFNCIDFPFAICVSLLQMQVNICKNDKFESVHLRSVYCCSPDYYANAGVTSAEF